MKQLVLEVQYVQNKSSTHFSDVKFKIANFRSNHFIISNNWQKKLKTHHIVLEK